MISTNYRQTTPSTKRLKREIKTAIRAKPALKEAFLKIERLYIKSEINKISYALTLIDDLLIKNINTNNKVIRKLNKYVETPETPAPAPTTPATQPKKEAIENIITVSKTKTTTKTAPNPEPKPEIIPLLKKVKTTTKKAPKTQPKPTPKQEPKKININNTLYFNGLEDSTTKSGQIIKGGFNKLKTILKTLDHDKQNIILYIYGTLEDIKGRDTEDITDIYKPDETYTIIYKVDNLSEYATGRTGEKYKGALYSIIAGLRNYGSTTATGEFKIINIPTAEKYDHKFKYGPINCFLSSITEQLNKGQRTKKNIEIVKEKIKKLNDRYFKNGVSIADISNIENILNISIDIYNKAKIKIYNSMSNNKGQKIILKTPYINHISEHIQEINNIKDKNKILIDDIETHYKNNTSNYKYFKTDINNKKIFYHDELNIYYSPLIKNDEIINKDNIYIYNELSYQQDQFIKENELFNNFISTEQDPELFEFINNSIHHLNKFSNKELLKKHGISGNYNLLHSNVIKQINQNKKDKQTKLFNNFISNDNPINPYKNPLDADIEEDNEPEHTTKETDINNFYTIDNNKCFIGYTNEDTPAGKIFSKLGIPNNKFNFYRVEEQPNQTYINKILNDNYISFLHIKPIFKNKTIEAVLTDKTHKKEIKQGFIYIDISNEFIFTSFFIKYLLDNDIIETIFLIRAIATATGQQELFFNEDIIDNKFYNEIIGVMSSKAEHSTIKFEVKDETEIKDILYYKQIENNKETNIFINNNVITLKTKKPNITNRGHISSVLLSYALINIIDVLKDIDINNLLHITADAITTLKPIKAPISTKRGEWKHQDKDIINIEDYNHYFNIKELDTFYNNLYILTEEKQQYKKYNFITGEAGTGKTSQFIKPFKHDNRLYNSLFLVPSNCLLNELSKDNNININTYQGFIMAFTHQDPQHQANKKEFIKYSNIILDETTMINAEEMKQIFKIVFEYDFNIFIIGDYNIKNKKAYQLKPVKGDEWFKKPLDDHILKESYFKHLTINHRQDGDKEFYNLLQNIRGKTNDQIKNIIINDNTIKKIKYDTLIKEYDINDKILSSVNIFIDKINKDITPKEDIKILYTTTTSKHAKNETAIIKASEYDDKKMKLGYAQTAHTAQGLTFNNNIYININNLFTNNILYVMLSRAKRKEQIYIIE